MKHLIDHLSIFNCPSCGGDLEMSGSGIECLACRNRYPIENDIPLLFQPNEWDRSREDVTSIVKAFYEETPFPDYEDFENVSDLIQKAQKSIFARLLNEQVPFNIKILEVGCGTGQLSNFLGTAHRTVFGTDICLNSLQLAEEFRKKNGLERVGFYQMNLFRPVFREESFSLIICNGVLHSTSDPRLGFQTISRLVKKGGYIIIGLYNRYGRIINDIRRAILKTFDDRLTFLDPHLKRNKVGDSKKLSWFRDQYKHPHESKHTIGEVLRWFDQAGFEFINGIPKPKAFTSFSENEELFKPQGRGSRFDHFLVQTRLLVAGKEGGFSLMIGRRRF